MGPGSRPRPTMAQSFLWRHPRLAERSSRIYEVDRVVADQEDRMRECYAAWRDYVDKEKPAADHIWNTDETGVTPQVIKARKIVAERGQKVVATKRSNCRENVTVVATINAAGEVTPPLIIF
ncbi:unnamed protein product [Sphacelaria rigidula]